MPAQSHVRWFDEIGLDDIPEVGGKTASLGELCSALGSQGIRVPDGFALTAACYREALDAAGAWDALRRLLAEFDHRDVALWPSGPPPPAVSSMTRRGHPACVTKFWRLTARSKENAGRASPSRCAIAASRGRPMSPQRRTVMRRFDSLFGYILGSQMPPNRGLTH